MAQKKKNPQHGFQCRLHTISPDKITWPICAFNRPAMGIGSVQERHSLWMMAQGSAEGDSHISWGAESVKWRLIRNDSLPKILCTKGLWWLPNLNVTVAVLKVQRTNYQDSPTCTCDITSLHNTAQIHRDQPTLQGPEFLRHWTFWRMIICLIGGEIFVYHTQVTNLYKIRSF